MAKYGQNLQLVNGPKSTLKIVDCVCRSIRSMFRVLGIYNFGQRNENSEKDDQVPRVDHTYETQLKQIDFGHLRLLQPGNLGQRRLPFALNMSICSSFKPLFPCFEHFLKLQ